MNLSMTEPTVCAIMLTRDRPEMARLAVDCFRAQTYPHGRRRLLIWDSSPDFEAYTTYGEANDITPVPADETDKTIGALRNRSVDFWNDYDIVVHWDDDDWSHPNRIAEQVALLQSTGADCVGYNEMLFWDSRPGQFCGAWLYSNPAPRYALGTSLCYWRRTWERNPFPATSQGEDFRWLAKLAKVQAISSLIKPCCGYPMHEPPTMPRMIASIHGGNTSNAYNPAKMQASEWKRVPEWDKPLLKRMKL